MPDKHEADLSDFFTTLLSSSSDSFITEIAALVGIKPDDGETWNFLDYLRALDKIEEDSRTHRISLTLTFIPMLLEHLSEQKEHASEFLAIQRIWEELHQEVESSDNPRQLLSSFFQENSTYVSNLHQNIQFLSRFALIHERDIRRQGFSMDTWVETTFLPNLRDFFQGNYSLW